MTAEIFQVREQALEYDFFHKVDEELLKQLRASLDRDQKRRALADATGITEEAVLDELVDLRIDTETLFALSLFPLVWVAWVDGKIDPDQRQVILAAAHATGHESDKASHQLIDTWLNSEPSPKLQTAWKDYVAALCNVISGTARESLREDVLRRTSRIADTVSPRYGFHDVEAKLADIMQEIESAFDVI